MCACDLLLEVIIVREGALIILRPLSAFRTTTGALSPCLTALAHPILR